MEGQRRMPEFSQNNGGKGKMTNFNDRNRQIRAKNLFGDEVTDDTSRQKIVAEKNVQSIRSSVMKSVGKQGTAGVNSGKKNMPGKALTGQNATKKESVGIAATKQETMAKRKSTTQGKKSPRQKQQAYRFYICTMLAVFVLFVMGWGICQLVRAINTGESQNMVMVQPGEQVVDNSANAGKSIDVDKLVNTVLDNVTFEAELNLLEDSVASGMIDTTEGTDLRIYMGNGTYSDELVVMTALNEKDAEQNQKNAETHLAEMQKQFSDYIPKEAKKIDGAIRVRCGCYVVVCVTNDTQTAKKTIDTFMKK